MSRPRLPLSVLIVEDEALLAPRRAAGTGLGTTLIVGGTVGTLPIITSPVVPLMVTTTEEVVPSAERTVKVSVSDWPWPRFWIAVFELDAV